jgi:hypothetical protein
MSNPENEASKVLSGVQKEIGKLSAESVKVKSFYEKHVTAIVGVLMLVIGLVIGHYAR